MLLIQADLESTSFAKQTELCFVAFLAKQSLRRSLKQMHISYPSIQKKALGKFGLNCIMLNRVTKSENFPDSKIFVAKTFRIKRVNRVDFQICDKCAKKVFLQDFVHKHGPNMLSTSYRHSSRSSKLSLYYPDIFLN